MLGNKKMAHFIGNNFTTLDVDKIVVIYWNVTDFNGLSHAEINLIEGHQFCLYYVSDDDFKLINDLREEFGYEPLPRIK